MPRWDDAIKFLWRVLPWPASPTDAGFGNIHWTKLNTLPNPKVKAFWQGQAFKTHIKAADYIDWVFKLPDSLDIYFCTSLQKETTKNRNGKEIAWRDTRNFLASKILYLDIDVKPPPKGYTDLPEAVRELAKFCKHWGLPPPSALVGSGGGLHVYWISNRALPLTEWQPLADALKAAAAHFGLRCDLPVTSDPVRVLRIPGTVNHKFTPPAEVKLLALRPADYDFAVQLAPALAKVPPHVATPTTPTAPAPVALPAAFAKRTLPAIYAKAMTGEGAAGIEPESPPLNTVAIFKGCEWLKNSLRTGGKDNDQHLWMLSVLATTFLDDGRKLAHKLSKGWAKGTAAYDPAETDAMFDRKERERAERDMGWPSCRAIEGAGCKDCATCPFYGKVNHPHDLGLAPKPAVTAASNTELRPGYANWSEHLPDGYAFNDAGVVCVVVQKKEKDADGNIEYVPELLPLMLHQQMLAPWIQYNVSGSDALHFEVDGNMGRMRHVFIEREHFVSSMDTAKVLSRQGVALNPPAQQLMGAFMNSFVRRMELYEKSANAKPFGWVANDLGQVDRFVYGGVTFHKDGTTSPGGYASSRLRLLYTPVGDPQPWLDAAQFVINQGKPELDMLLAGTFAAPLIQFTGQDIGVLSVYGDSGGGKSTTLKIAAGLWGHPKDSRIAKGSTTNSVGHMMGATSHLPILWDEVSEEKHQIELHTIVMNDGQQKNRLIARSGMPLEMRDDGNWSTLIVCAANLSYLTFLASHQKDTNSGRYRAVEVRIDPPPPGTVPPSQRWDVDAMLHTLNSNFGHGGMVYSKYLATQVDNLKDRINARGKAFDERVKARQQERYWSIVSTVLLVGAELAIECGLVNFDMKRLEDFVIKTFFDMRAKITTSGNEGPDAAQELITSYIKEHSQHSLVTDSYPFGVGKSHVTMLSFPPRNQFKGIYVQWVTDPKQPLLMIPRSKLDAWLQVNKRQASAVYDHIQHRIERLTLGRGTEYTGGRERVVLIDIVPGSWLRQVMNDLHGAPPSTATETPNDDTPKYGLSQHPQNAAADTSVSPPAV